MKKDERSKMRRRVFFLIAFPPVGLVLVMILDAIAQFIFVSLGADTIAEGELTSVETAEAIVGVLLGLLGIVCVIGFFIAIPIGISRVNKSRTLSTDHEKKPKLSEEEIKKQIRRWNWGAFFFSWLWGLANRVWISLLVFIPIVSIFVQFYLGFKGNELAWEKGRWTSVEQFHKVQKNWAIAALTFFLLLVILAVIIEISSSQ